MAKDTRLCFTQQLSLVSIKSICAKRSLAASKVSQVFLNASINASRIMGIVISSVSINTSAHCSFTFLLRSIRVSKVSFQAFRKVLGDFHLFGSSNRMIGNCTELGL